MAEEGDGSKHAEREEVAVDAEDDAVDADVERLLRDDVVPRVDELRPHHRRVRPPRFPIPRRRRHRADPIPRSSSHGLSSDYSSLNLFPTVFFFGIFPTGFPHWLASGHSQSMCWALPNLEIVLTGRLIRIAATEWIGPLRSFYSPFSFAVDDPLLGFPRRHQCVFFPPFSLFLEK